MFNEIIRYYTVLLLLSVVFSACDGGNAPLDADTRSIIDSTSSSQISLSRVELDSLCLEIERTQLPILVDSIKKVRQMEIERQLKLIIK